jgi:hypothetical protein
MLAGPSKGEELSIRQSRFNLNNPVISKALGPSIPFEKIPY